MQIPYRDLPAFVGLPFFFFFFSPAFSTHWNHSCGKVKDWLNRSWMHSCSVSHSFPWCRCVVILQNLGWSFKMSQPGLFGFRCCLPVWDLMPALEDFKQCVMEDFKQCKIMIKNYLQKEWAETQCEGAVTWEGWTGCSGSLLLKGAPFLFPCLCLVFVQLHRELVPC